MVFQSKFVFEPIIVQVQDIFKDVNAQCNVLNIRQPVLQLEVIIVLSFVSRHLKNDSKVLKIEAKLLTLDYLVKLVSCWKNELLSKSLRNKKGTDHPQACRARR